MKFVFLCPHCALSLEAGEELYGTQCACPQCAGAFVVPDPEGQRKVGEFLGRMEEESSQRDAHELVQLREALAAVQTELSQARGELRAMEERWEVQRRGLEEEKARALEGDARARHWEGECGKVRAELEQALKEQALKEQLWQERALREQLLQERAQLRVEGRSGGSGPEGQGGRESEPRCAEGMRPTDGGGVKRLWRGALVRMRRGWVHSKDGGVPGPVWAGLGGAVGILLAVAVNRIEPFFAATSGMAAGLDRAEGGAGGARLEPWIAGVSVGRIRPKTEGGFQPLPTSFMGVPLGVPLSEVMRHSDKGVEWKEIGGRLYRPVEFSGRRDVHAVLVPNHEGKVVMGAFVKACSTEPKEVREFLEWAVTVGDEMSTLYGQPSEVHQVEGVQDSETLLERIRSGSDFYEAIWEREGQDTRLALSIRQWKEQSVVFRLEYVSLRLARELSSEERAAGTTP